MNIVIIQDYLRPGGTEKQSIFIANFLNDSGHIATILTFRPGGPLVKDIQANTPHISLQKKDTNLDFYAPGIFKTVTKLSPDIILCMGTIANSYASFIQKRISTAHIICTLRTGKSLNWLFKHSLKTCPSILTNCQWWKNKLLEQGFNGNKIKVIRNALAIQEPLENTPTKGPLLESNTGDSAPEGLIFLCVQGFRPGKKQAKLIHYFSQINPLANWQLWFVGDGPTREACEKLARKLKLSEKIHFFGYQADPRPYYEKAHVAVSSSKEDAFPNFIIEAQYFGLPVIALDTVGVKEAFLDDFSGFLISNHNPKQDFPEAINRFIKTPSLIYSMGKAGKQHVLENFSPALIKEKTRDYLNLHKPKKQTSRVCILIRWFTSADAVSQDALSMYYALKDAGYNAHLFVNEHHRSVCHETFHPFSSIQEYKLTQDDLIIYHFTSAWPECFDFLKTTKAKKILRYHNITPASYFENYSPSHYERCQKGREFLKNINSLNWHSVLSPSTYNANELIEHGIEKNIISILPPFHQTDKLLALADLAEEPHKLQKKNEKTIIKILSVGRLSPNKNHADLIKVFAHYRNYNNLSELIIIGKHNKHFKTYIKELQELAIRLNVIDAITWVEGASDKELVHYYKECNILAITSNHEGFCVPIIEAMALKLPVIAFNNTAIPETIGNAGILIENNDTQKMAEEIHILLSNSEKRSLLVNQGKMRFNKHFTNFNIKSSLIKFIENNI